MATDQQIIQILKDTGHLDNPFGDSTGAPLTVRGLQLSDPHVKRAVASYQDFMSIPGEFLVAKHHPQRISAAIIADGDVGPATRELFGLPRCGFPDYGEVATAAAMGTGNWKQCHGSDFHHAKIRFLNSPPQRWLDHWDAIWDIFVRSYAEMGLLWERDDNATRPEATFEFVNRSDGWIGLAIMGGGSSCGSNIWARFLSTYMPPNIPREVSTLIRHEAGHLTGHGHTRGGVMNPSLVGGLAPTFVGDPIENSLRSMFGGVPVPVPGDGSGERKLVVGFEYGDGRFEKLYDLPSGGDMWPS